MLKLLATLSRATVSAVLCCFCLLAAFAPRETASAWLPVPPAQDTPARLCGDDAACLRQRFLRIDAATIEALAPDLGLVELPTSALRPLYPYDLRRFSSALTPTRLGHQPTRSSRSASFSLRWGRTVFFTAATGFVRPSPCSRR